MSEKNSDKNIAAIVNAFKILDYLNENALNGVNKIAAATQIPKTTVHRILQTLLAIHVLNQTASGNYELSHKLASYNIQNAFTQTLINISKDKMDSCAKTLGETVNLGISFNAQFYIIHYSKSKDHVLQMQPKISSPLHCSGSGKIFLYDYSSNELANYFKQNLCKYTENTLTSLAELKKEFKAYEQSQVFFDNEEFEYGLKCVAVAIKDANGKAVASLRVSGPVNRLEHKGIGLISKELLATAAAISNEL